MLEDKFKSEIEKYKKENEKYIKQYDIVGYLRLAVFIAIAVPLYRYMKYKTVSTLLFLIPLILFIALVIYHRKIKEKQKYVEDMININEDYIKRINGGWREFKDGGEEFIDSTHPYSSDLDLFGKDSLFKLINVTNTFFGRKALANSMRNKPDSVEAIEKRQRAVEELSSKLEFCEKVQYAGRSGKVKKSNPEKLIKYMDSDEVVIKSAILKKVIYFIPIVFIPLSAIIIVFKLHSLTWLINLFIIINIAVWTFKASKLSAVLANVGGIKDEMYSYLEIINAVSKEEFQSEVLKDIKASLVGDRESAQPAIKKLYNISERVNMRDGGFQYFFFNILFLWDYQCVFSLDKWKNTYGGKIRSYLEAIGFLEELISISVLNHINENTIYPQISRSGMDIEGENIGHLLINRDTRVNNDVNMKDNILIITGSNMSGKTTYLRTIGINLVIAYMGGKVCADSFKAPILEIYTSMRISDDLMGGISTFYGELIRIKEIIKRSKNCKSFIFLIDEIFRGTNSKDRITGAEAVIKNLEKAGAIGALTTHDLEICSVDRVGRVHNYHFEEFYKDNKIYFDYKIRPGISKSTNAEFLMKMVGIDI